MYHDLTTEERTKRLPNIGWKKVFCDDGNDVLLLLWIEEKTNIQQPTKENYGIARKVEVLAIFDMWGYETSLKKAKSHFDKNFVYTKGKTYSPKEGIWYWPTFNQAKAYWVNAEGANDYRYEELAKQK